MLPLIATAFVFARATSVSSASTVKALAAGTEFVSSASL